MRHFSSTRRNRLRAAPGILLLGLSTALGAAAQDQALLDQVQVTPLAEQASCYPGTIGEDFTVFLRIDYHRIDCDVMSGRAPCLARREFPADGPNGQAISLEAAVVIRPSVSGNGVSVWFSEFGFALCGMNTASSRNEGCLNRDGTGLDFHSVATSPFGNEIAFTIRDPDNGFLPSNAIGVADSSTFALLETYVVETQDAGGGSLQLESVDFTVNGDFLIIDAYNPVLDVWGIYAVDRSSGDVLTVVAPVSGLHLRNPTLAQTSDDHIAFDAQDPVTGDNTVLAANLLTGELSQVASTSGLGYPSYTGDDSAIVFTDQDAGTETQFSLDVQSLASDRLTPIGARSRWLTDGGVGVVYRRGNFDGRLKDPTECVPEPSGVWLQSTVVLALVCLSRSRSRRAR